MGEIFALLTAAFWAGAVICFKRSGEHLPPLLLNLFRVSVSAVLLLATMMVVGQPPWRAATGSDYLLILASGVIAIAVADTLFHASLNRIGAGLTAIVDCLYPPLTALFAFTILAEHLTAGDLVGMVLVVAAVLLTTQARLPVGLTRRGLLVGLLLGALGMAALSLGIVIVKPVLATQPVIWVTGMRQFVALAVLVPTVAVSPDRRQLRDIRRLPRRALLLALAGTVLGSYLSLTFWIAGMKFTSAGTAAILNQTSTIYILILATLLLHEPFTRRKLLACSLAVGGVAAVILA
jgi:drug/metabolite transporter (DMT)-like permease